MTNTTNIVRQFRTYALGEGEVEQRAEARHRALKRGVLTFFGGYCTREATVEWPRFDRTGSGLH